MSIKLLQKKLRFIFYILCIVLLQAACQQTPENEIIVNKGNSALEEMILIEAPTTEDWTSIEDRIVWNETKKVNSGIGECKVAVNMNVVYPEYPGKVPVMLIESKEFRMDFLKKTASYLLKGETFDGTESKQDIMAEIIAIKDEVSSHTIDDSNKIEIEDRLEYLSQICNEVSECNNEAKFDFIVNDKGQNGFQVKGYLDDGSLIYFTALADKADKCFGFSSRIKEFNRSFCYLNKESGENIQASGIKTTYEQALSLANDCMSTLFKEPYVIVHANTIDKVDNLEYLWNDGNQTSLEQAYVFCYSREYGGFPSLYIDPPSSVVTEETDYAKPYPREYAVIVVNDNGLVIMVYNSYSRTLKMLNDAVKILPFEEILERFKSEVFHHYLWGKSAEIKITRIEFGMIREPLKNNLNQYIMVPAWNFVGDVKSDWVEETEKSISVINAIDGSIATDYESICNPL